MRMSLTRKLTAAIATVALLGSLITGVQPSSAATNRPACITAQPSNCKLHRLTPAEVIQLYGHKSLGPARWSDWGKIQFTKWVRHHKGNRTWWTAPYKVTHPNPPPTGATWAAIYGPNDWWNPATWHWSAPFKAVGRAGDWLWSKIGKCAGGAMKGFMGNLTYPLLTDFLYYKAVIGSTNLLTRNPYGLALTSVVGCAWGISGH